MRGFDLQGERKTEWRRPSSPARFAAAMGVFVLALDASGSRAATTSVASVDPASIARLEQAAGDPRRFGPATRGVIEDLRSDVSSRPRAAREARAAIRTGAAVAAGACGLGIVAFVVALLRSSRGRAAPLGNRLLAAGLLFLGVTLVGGTTLGIRAAQVTLPGLQPTAAANAAGLDALDAEAEATTSLGAAAVARALDTTARGEGTVVANLLDAAASHAPGAEVHGGALRIAGHMVEGSVVVADHAPIALALLLALALLGTSRPAWRAIVEISAHAAPEPHVAAAVRRSLLDRVVRELLAIVVLVLAAGVGGILVAASASAIAGVSSRATVSLTLAVSGWSGRPDVPSDAALVLGLGASAFFVVIAVAFAVVLVTTTIARAHGLLLQRLHHGAALGSHGRFWRHGAWGMVVALAMPIGHALAMTALAEGPIADAFGSGGAGLMRRLVLVSAAFVVGYVAVVWATRGIRALVVVATTSSIEPSPMTARSPSPMPMIEDVAGPLPPPAIPVARRHSGPPALVSTLPSASEPPAPRGVDLGPLSSTTPSATSPDELDGNRKPRRA